MIIVELHDANGDLMDSITVERAVIEGVRIAEGYPTKILLIAPHRVYPND